MKFQRKKVATALAYVLGVGSVALLTATYAQAQQADIKVDVTGSNIKRVEGEGALPVTVLTRSQIEKTGATNAMELLQVISSNNSSGNVSLGNVIGATTFSNQTASLRGLGGQRTLVLIDGQRVSSTGGAITGAEGVNLSLIPFAAIERVEVLKDGASAIYGSDAIGGVINFIMRQDYRGAEGMIQYGAPTRSGGGDQLMASGSVGFGDLSKDRYNVFMSLAYTDQKNLEQRDRNFSNTSLIPNIGLFGISGNTFPAYISTGTTNGPIGSVNFPECASPNVVDIDNLGNRCFFDPSRMAGVQQIPDDKLWNFFGSARFQINRDWQAYGTFLYARDETRFRIQPVPISDQFAAGNFAPTGQILLPPTSPFYPHDLAIEHGVDGQPLNVRYRCVECGLRDTTDINENGQFTAGIKGAWKNWDWDGSVFYAESKTKDKLNGGFPLYSQILPLLNSGVVNPFGPNSPEVSAQIQSTLFNGTTFDGTAKNYGVRGKTSGEVFKLPAGMASVAFGGEVRKETLEQVPSDVLATGDVSGFGGNIVSVNKSRNIWAAYAEMNVPILKTLEGDVAVRYDHYSDFGATTNPKVSLRWQPTSSFLVRTSYGTGFLAPSLYDLYIPVTTGVSSTGANDPLRCSPAVPVDQESQNDCNTQFPVTLGGNPSLQPERSFQATVGFVWEPVSGASLSVDYFKLNLSNAISSGPSTAQILGDLGRFSSYVSRGPVDPTQPTLPGHITNITQTLVNQGNVHIQGLDLQASYQTPTSSWGRFRFDVAGTYYIKYDNQNVDGSYTGGISSAYAAVATGIIPRYKQYASVTWDQGPWSATVANTYQSDYTDYQVDIDGNLRKVSSMSLWDLKGSYTGFKNWTLALGVKNVFDTNPPQSNQQNTFQLGYDPSYYDPRARFVYGSVSYAFK
ncbi:MAG: TonB-dependent receptor [Betaproteobacteria bacterium]